jgi:ABC-type multidrug transport system fused ATPase/permease subunit
MSDVAADPGLGRADADEAPLLEVRELVTRFPVRRGLVGALSRAPRRFVHAVDGVSLSLRPGEMLALVGPSGGGKTTLLSLLLRFIDPSAGRIIVGEHDLRRIDAPHWRRHLAYLPQRPTLFRGTIADNVRLGDPGADDAPVRAATALAGADGFVRALPNGYETVVGEGGRVLSSGELRRLALARAFLRDAPLVLLDEPTADLDPASAAIVADAVERLRAGRTVLLVAHDAELAARADRIVRIDAGVVVAEAMV